MNEPQLTPHEITLLHARFAAHPNIEKVVLFGSRAKGCARANSDIDFAVWGAVDALQIAALALELDDLPLPYKFDVQTFSAITHQPLREHIERAGVVFYENPHAQK